MLFYTYATASCPPLRDGIETTSKSILVVALPAFPSLANPRETRYVEHRRIGLPEHGRSILARKVIRRHPLCVIAWSACGVEPTISRTVSQSIVAAT